ncbi:HAMP domain-containing sensor histidine kinase [Peptoniphilus catoniae]|uniref:HAMP domain-containing sensor histidine kinase n=1 Tax=Peptoniphilus catoniae TaxID=1660341 RepID=UPI0010FF436F|nr:ATP-binding protein [Peptoniphilus catoniae]
MFSSIRYRFITIYFVLVLICMAIVGAFIINRLEVVQIESAGKEMNRTLMSIENTSGYLATDVWDDKEKEIHKSLSSWRISQNDTIYAISASKDVPTIITSTSNAEVSGKSALSHKSLEPSLILKALKGDEAETIVIGEIDNLNSKHIAKPIFSPEGKIRGILYMTSNLSEVYDVVDKARSILTYATGIALLITTILGYIIAKSITEPIRTVTKKASLMAKGDFSQKVDVKSNDEIGNLGHMFNYLTDELNVTISKMELEKSKLNTIFNHMTEGVVAINRKGLLIQANPIARKILNIDTDYVDRFFDLSTLNIKVDYNDLSSLEGESEVEIKDRFYKIKYAPFMLKSLYDLGIIVVLQDMTKEHALDSMRKDFVANVSHELKTPITSIKSYGETLLMSKNLNPRERKFLEVINNESNRMSSLVTDLLELSDLDYKSYKPKFERIDTYDLISSTLDHLELLIKEKKHKIVLDIPMDIKDISADRNSADRILINIISNAIKYTDKFGKVEISAYSDDNKVCIVVKDNGIGIPKEDMPRIFERFYRVEKSRSREMGGTGLGLSISKNLAESMGGSLELDSDYGKGTAVKITLKACG